MPTYAYTCTACDSSMEVRQSFTDDALTECPQCGGRLRKVFSGVGVVFKGSGFYRTDSRGSNNGGSGSGDAGKGSDGASSGGEKSPAPAAAPAGSSTSSSSGGSSSTSSSTSSSSSAAPASSA